jgi:hypothetical protein
MRSNALKAVFRECLKFILEIIRKSGKIRTYYDFTPKVNFLNRTWHLELEHKNTYPHLFEFENELMNSSIVKKCLALMLEEDFPRLLEMEIVDKRRMILNLKNDEKKGVRLKMREIFKKLGGD